MDLAAALQKNDLFSPLPAAVLREDILPHGHWQTVPKGQAVIVPQQRVDRLSVLLTGRVHILHLFPSGQYSLTSVLTPGKVLGADLVCTRTQLAPYHALAALTTQLFSLPIDLFSRPGLLGEDCRLTVLQRLLTLVSQENMRKEYRLAILAQRGLRERILVYLSMQADRRQTNTFTIPFSREEMASFLCVNRSALSHELSLMQQEGLITFHKNHFTLLRPERGTL